MMCNHLWEHDKDLKPIFRIKEGSLFIYKENMKCYKCNDTRVRKLGSR